MQNKDNYASIHTQPASYSIGGTIAAVGDVVAVETRGKLCVYCHRQWYI